MRSSSSRSAADGPSGKIALQRRIELLREPAREVHRAERVLEAAVLGGGEDPARRLQLRDAAQPLHPRGVDDVLLGGFPGDPARPRVENVLVDGIRDERPPAVRVGGALHACATTARAQGRGPVSRR